MLAPDFRHTPMQSLVKLYSAAACRAATAHRALGQSLAWLCALMVLLTAGIVIVRAVSGINSIAAQELVTYFHATLIMLACTYTLAEQDHVRVDIFYRQFSPRAKAWVDLAGNLLFLLPLGITICAISWDFVLTSWALKEGSADAGGLPAVYWLKTLLLLNGAMLALYALSDSLQQLAMLTPNSTTTGEA